MIDDVYFFKNFRSLSHILLLQMDNYSEMQVKTFSRGILEDLRKDIKSNSIRNEKVTRDIKLTLQEYIEVFIILLLKLSSLTISSLLIIML